MDIHLVDVVISLINIIVLFFLLRLILWKHVVRYLSNRSSRIQGELDDASKTRREAESLKSEYSEKLASLEAQGEMIIRSSRQKADIEAEKIINNAKISADRIMRDTDVRIELNKQEALIEMQNDIAQLASEMAAGILGREVTHDDNARAVEVFFHKE